MRKFEFFRVTIKGKIFQIRFLEEVHPDKGKAERSKTTGHLVVTLPKAKHFLYGGKTKRVVKTVETVAKSDLNYLEVTGQKSMDFSKIVPKDEFDDLPSLEPIPD